MSNIPHFSEEALEDLLRALLRDEMRSEHEELLERVTSAHKYEDTGILTRQRGLVIRTDDDWEFQVSIVVSRRGVETVSCPNCGHEYDDDGDEIDMQGYCDFCRPADADDEEDEGDDDASTALAGFSEAFQQVVASDPTGPLAQLAADAQQSSAQRQAERLQQRRRRYDELSGRPKAELLALYSRLRRVHALTLRDSKGDIISAILEEELPVR